MFLEEIFFLKATMADEISSLGLTKSKLVLGLLFYGRGWLLEDIEAHGLGASAVARVYASNHTKEAGVWSFYEICQNIKADAATNTFEEKIGASYAYNNLWWIGYNDVKTIRTKVSTRQTIADCKTSNISMTSSVDFYSFVSYPEQYTWPGLAE